jgi:hypothetical protein
MEKKIKMKKLFESWKKYLNEEKSKDDPCWGDYEQIGMKEKGGKKVPNCVPIQKEEKHLKEKKKKKPCKKAKGKKFVTRVNGRCRSYGQSGKAKDGRPRIRRGTKHGDAYCARSAKIKKCKNPPCANTLSRKKWGCRGSKSVAE